MNRTFTLKLSYTIAVILVSASVIWLLAKHSSLLLFLIVIGILLTPGRVQGYFFRDLFTARRLLDIEKPQESVTYSLEFLEKLRNNPYLNKLLWLTGSVYTISAEAMCLNNLGAAELLLGNLTNAEKHFSAALLLDSKYPLPHFNLAVIYKLQGNEQMSEKHQIDSLELGYTGGTSDAVVKRAQSLLAKIEG